MAKAIAEILGSAIGIAIGLYLAMLVLGHVRPQVTVCETKDGGRVEIVSVGLLAALTPPQCPEMTR